MQHIQNLVAKEDDLKRLLKETRDEIKDAIEETTLYKQVLESTLTSDYEVSEKTARAHAFKVVRAKFDKKEEQ